MAYAQAMTRAQIKRKHEVLGWTLAVMTALSLIAGQVSQRDDRLRREARDLRAEAQRTSLERAPVSDFFEYPRARQVGRSAPPEGPLIIASDMAAHAPGEITFNIALRCDSPAGFLSTSKGAVMYARPTVMGFEGDARFDSGYVRHQGGGRWTYRGALPQGNADCEMTIVPCMKVNPGMQKCLGLDVSPIRIRIRETG